MSWKSFLTAIAACLTLSTYCGAASLISGETALKFDGLNGHAVLSELKDLRTGHEFIDKALAGKGLWRIELRTPNGDPKSAVTIEAADAIVTRVSQSAISAPISLTWTAVAIPGGKGTLDITAAISPAEGSMTDWRITVYNHSSTLGLWQVNFPCITGLTAGTYAQAATPFGMGQINTDPVHDSNFGFDDIYPNCLYSMQFASLNEDGSCLYLASHDPHAYLKRMRFAHSPDGKSLTYEIGQLPPNMGVPGQRYVQPYPCIVGVLLGDWVDAAKFYRKWVLANSDWMKDKKQLSQRNDLPDWFKRLPYWVGFHGMTDSAMAMDAADIKNAGVPAGVQMYHWHDIPFDHRYPDFWPPHDNTKGYIDQLHGLGAKVMPYINLHLMDELSKTWIPDNAAQYAVKNPDGSLQVEIDDPDRHMVVMCPGTSYWQHRFDDLAVKLTRDLDVDGIYCDQVAAIRPTLCFDPHHGHTLGGGDYWVAGYAKTIKNLRKAAASVKKNVFFATESAAEPYDFDLYLRCNEGAPWLTPIWQLVYSGYRLSYGFYFYEDREWIAKFATQYLWGVEIGWAGQHDPATNPVNARFERECAQARYAGSNYLALGEMLRAPKLTGNFARYKTTWRNFASLFPIDWPAVQGSLWKAPDGSLGLALVNLHTSPQTATFEIDRRDAGLADGPVKLSALYPKGVVPNATLPSGPLKATVTLPAQSVVMLVLRSANRN